MRLSRRPRFRRRRTVRRRFRRKAPMRAMRRSFKRKGFVKRYKKAAFQGRFVPRWSKYFRSANKRVLTNWTINQTLTNVNTAGTDNAWVMLPVANIIQTGQAQDQAASAIPTLPQEQFTGTQIFLKGIKLDFLIAPQASQDFYFRLLCFWTKPDVDILNQTNAAGPAWNSFVNTGVAGNTIGGSKLGQGALGGFNFLDLPYATASAYSNMQNIVTRPNPNYPGKLLYDFKKKLTCTASIATNGGNPTYHHSVYLPFNKIFTFMTYPYANQEFDTVIPNLESLTVRPNFGANGQPIFVIYYCNTIDIPPAGTESSMYISGTSRIYFKDIGA